MVFGLGPAELLVILIIVIFIFGGRRIPEIGQSLGKSIREFKKAKNQYSEVDPTEKWIDKSSENKTGGAHNASLSDEEQKKNALSIGAVNDKTGAVNSDGKED